jgi:anionic cell wall polymer biosynthesis LytR-Cps2A-Psr (LCP) family protein
MIVMKKVIAALVILIILISCGSNKSDQPITENDSVTDIYLWRADLNDSSGRLEMKKEVSGIDDSLTVPDLFNYLDSANTNIKLDFIKISGDTIYAKIDDATYLTQQMGTTGAMQYMARTVYNLTELPGIHYVNLNFEEGDHAAPGVFNRDSFKNE